MSNPIVKQRKIDESVSWPETVHPLLQRIYSSRNLTSAEEVDLTLKKLLPPSGLKNIEQAAALLLEALTHNLKILIIGDFDADGATSTALAIRVLKAFGHMNIDYLVPNRFAFGYGLTPGIVNEAIKLTPDLIITVDNGISSVDGVALAKSHGIKVLVTDHHLQGNQLPGADVIVNPNQHGDGFQSKALAGVGVIYYVLIALRQQLRQVQHFSRNNIPEPNMADFLDIVALGTVADVVQLDQNNRTLVKEGLKRIRSAKCIAGIKALLQVAGRNYRNIVASDLGFAVGPRLNAAGRLDDMSIGIECLLADGSAAEDLAFQLDSFNRNRRHIEDDMKAEAINQLASITFDDTEIYGLALFNENWHQGVIGILASRIKEKIHRPVIIFAPGEGEEIKGSARSIPGLHIRDVLESISTQNDGLIKKFGGHAMAAGLSIQKKDFECFHDKFNQAVALHSNDEIFDNVIFTDGQLQTEDFTMETVRLLEEAGPWGQGFPEPLFQGSFQVVSQRILKMKHYKLVLSPDESPDLYLDAIAFNCLEGDESTEESRLPGNIELVYRLSINEFRGEKNLQLMIDHIL